MAAKFRWRRPRKKCKAGFEPTFSPTLTETVCSSQAVNISSAMCPCTTRSRWPEISNKKISEFDGQLLLRGLPKIGTYQKSKRLKIQWSKIFFNWISFKENHTNLQLILWLMKLDNNSATSGLLSSSPRFHEKNCEAFARVLKLILAATYKTSISWDLFVL